MPLGVTPYCTMAVSLSYSTNTLPRLSCNTLAWLLDSVSGTMPGSCLYIRVIVVLLPLKLVVSNRPNSDAAAYGLLLEYCANEYL
ncbi:hypothetical protein D3C86_2102700 [compost metagenome]